MVGGWREQHRSEQPTQTGAVSAARGQRLVVAPDRRRLVDIICIMKGFCTRTGSTPYNKILPLLRCV